MLLRTIAISVVLFGSLSSINSALAQTERTESQADPADNLFRLKAPDGTIVAADGDTRRFYIQTATGQTAEVTFDEALAAAEPDTVKRAQLQQEFETALSDERLAHYSYVDQPSDDPGDPQCDPSHGGACCAVQGCLKGDNQPGMHQSLTMDGITNLDGVTVVADRPSFTIGSITGADPVGTSFWSEERDPYENSDVSTEYQQCYAEDYNDFKEQQEAACGDVKLLAAGAVAAATSAANTCTAAIGTAGGGGLSAAACAGSVIAYAVALAKEFEADAQCRAVYPGPENC